MKYAKTWLLGLTATAIVIGAGSYYGGDLLKGTIPSVITTEDTNSADFGTADFVDKSGTTTITGIFTAQDSYSTISSGGTDGGAFSRESSGGADKAGLIYTFDAMTDLSGYKALTFWVRRSEGANTITVTLDDITGTDQSKSSPTGAPTNTWHEVRFDLSKLPDSDLDEIREIKWMVTDSSAVFAANYDLDQITLIK